MSSDLLQTKLHIPPPRPELVARQRLTGRLVDGLQGKLTLISAPAGFGKTTLVSSWIQEDDRLVAWLSLDEEDSEPTRFIAYLSAAVQTINPQLGANFSELLQAPQPPPLKSLLTILLNELVAQPVPFVLVLDDYHVLDAPAIHEGVAFLLDHLPPQMHLLITTREDPPLPLSRLRVRGQMTELRAADLRFTAAEAAAFLNQMMGLNLSEHEIEALEQRTEGWIAGLQLAALSIRQQADTAAFIEAFTGSHRFVLDYLVEEVLHSQPEETRRFLLETSILNRLNGSLCDALTDRDDGAEMLEALERGNLFVVPLDDERRWYRYHHLFADVLRTHLRKEPPDTIADLHQRASQWYEQHHWPAAAIRHALAAPDFERAAALIEMTWPALFNGFRPATWLGWVRALPDELVRIRPVLHVGCAWCLLDESALEGAEASLSAAEQLLDDSQLDITTAERVVVNQDVFQSLPASIASARAYLAQAQGDVVLTIKQAQRAIELFPEDEHYQQGLAKLFLGLAYWVSGNLGAAFPAIEQSVAHMQRVGNIYFQIVGTAILADLNVVQGQLHEAARRYKQSLALAQSPNGLLLQETADAYVGLSALHREWNELDTAADYLHKGQQKLAEQLILPGSQSRWCAALAQLKAAEGELDEALVLLLEAEQFYKRDPIPQVRSATAQRVRIWVKQGRLAEALDWVHMQEVSAVDELSYLREYEHITLARILVAQYEHEGDMQALQGAMGLLERLLQAAEAGGRTGSVIEILVIQALVWQLQNHMAEAVATVKRALALAEPEGYIRLFVDEGEPLRSLFAAVLTEGADPVYVTRLMGAIGQMDKADETAVSDPNQLLLEPLSNRELEVLGLLADGLSNQAIADELVIALSTVKKHVNNIFGKLNAASRTQAVSRARALNIL